VNFSAWFVGCDMAILFLLLLM